MFKFGTNQILLLSCLFLLMGTGTYVTYFHQRGIITSLEQQIEAKKEEKEEIEALQASLTDAEDELETVRRKWNTRYKIVPDTTSSPAVLSYLTELTQTGFKTFDVASSGAQQRNGYSAYTFRAEGEAFFSSLYRFIWTIENNRPFYRIRDLDLTYLEERTTDDESGRTSMDVLVSFRMDVEAIYGIVGGVEGEGQPSDERDLQALPVAQTAPSPPLPADVLPNSAPEINPFYPLVFDQVPPNEHGRLDVEAARLISIIDGKAIFEAGDGIERVGEGDRVYLGRIVEVSASDGRVVARLNRGGIVEEVEFTLNAESPLQKIRGEEGNDAQ